MTERLEYFRARIVSSNPGTTVYWADRHDGESFDIDRNDIPIHAVITDVTDWRSERKYQVQPDGELKAI